MKEMAKTLIFTGERQIELREYPIPEVSDDKVLVKVDACAICTWESEKIWSNLGQAIRRYPNILWTHTADMLASQILEV